MPLPTPKKSEKQGDFISRCAGNETMNKDFKDTKQRVAVCYSQWKKAKASAVASVGEGENEVLVNLGCKPCSEKNNLAASEEKYIIVENYKDCPFAVVSVEEDEAELEYCFSSREDAEEMLRLEMTQEEMKKKQDPNYLQKKMIEEMVDEKINEKFGGPVEAEAAETLEEYKKDFYEMSVGSLNSIKKHADNILVSLDNPMVKENLTESWLQGRIAITEDYMLTIHNYVMFVEEEDDEMEESEVDAATEEINENNLYIPTEDEYVTAEEVLFDESDVLEYDIAKQRPGLWENIRRKKQREGKNYKPAKPGDKDRPSPDAWKKAQGAEYQGRKVQLNKPFRTSGGPKKFAVYTKNESGNVVIVRFGDPNMKIKKNIPERRRSFRARHNCDNPGPKWKARYWSCKAW